MNLDFIILGGYGQYVWPAFIFTFSSFFFLYQQSKKELKKNEINYQIEFKTSPMKNVKVGKQKEFPKKIYIANTSF